jgi:hypothetical protein
MTILEGHAMKNSQYTFSRRAGFAGFALAGLVAGACSANNETTADAPDGGGNGNVDGSGSGPGSGGGGDSSQTPLFAVTTTVFDDTNAATYVALLDSLDDQQVDLSTAREFVGWSSIASHDGAIFVGHGEEPEVTRYSVTEAGSLASGDGQTVSFASYGLSTAPLSFNTFVDRRMAQMALEETSRILWDPVEMSILDSVETPQVAAERDGLTVTAANYQGRFVRPDGVFQPFFWHDIDWYEFHQQSQVAIYSRDGSAEALLDVPCPALQIVTEDEDGNLYFSGMVDTIPYQLRETGGGLERCVARIDAGAHQLADGWPRRFEELTEGRPAGVFHYLRDGIGILTVYHVENVDPGSDTFIDDWYTDNWALWLVDLDEWRAEPIEEWPLGSANIFFSRVDRRLFVHAVAADFSSTTIFEIAVEGTFERKLEIQGYAAYPILKVR